MSQLQTTTTTKRYSLLGDDIQVQSPPTAARELYTHTTIKAGIATCRGATIEEAEECCSQHKHASEVQRVLGVPSKPWGCFVDVGTGDWD